MLFTVTVDIATDRPLTIADLETVAAIGGAASGNPGEHLLGTTMTIDAASADAAGVEAAVSVTSLVTGLTVRLEILTVEEFDRRNDFVEV